MSENYTPTSRARQLRQNRPFRQLTDREGEEGESKYSVMQLKIINNQILNKFWQSLIFCLLIIFSHLSVIAQGVSIALENLPSQNYAGASNGDFESVFDGNDKTTVKININSANDHAKLLDSNPDGFFWWIRLEPEIVVEKVSVEWRTVPPNYKIQTSTDGEKWETVQVINSFIDEKDYEEILETCNVLDDAWEKKIHSVPLKGQIKYIGIRVPVENLKRGIELANIKIENQEIQNPSLQTLNRIKELEKEYVREISKQISEEFKFDEIVFATRRTKENEGHWYANISHYAGDTENKLYVEGGQLVKFNLNTGKTKTLLEDQLGNVRDPAVDYDGKTIVFSYRKGGEDAYHLFEIQSDGTGLKQLTFGEYDDFEPCFLPDGGLMFVSTRAKRYVQCWLTRVAVLHRCNRDGSNVQQISANVEHDNTPWMLNDGRVIYTRWEYVDRSQVDYHHLWAANPDGTGQMVYFGNMHRPDVFIDAKPVPNSDRVVFINSLGHGRPNHAGRIATVTDRFGPDDLSGINYITESADFCDPYPLTDNAILAARNNQLMFLNNNGKMIELFAQPFAECGHNGENVYVGLHEPRPLIARKKEPVVASRIDESKKTGQLILTDIYNGRNMKGVEKGSIKKLLVMEVLPKPINYTGGMDPISYGGTFSLERIMGTVPVEEDGSAFFELPALRSFFFIALDEKENSVKRMQSFTSVMPGETFSCVGCHEERTSTPANLYGTNMPVAFKRAPSKIEALSGIPDVYDFPKDIQPLLDRHCVECHQPSKRSGGVILTGDHGPMFSQSYFNLTVFRQVKVGQNLAESNHPPYAIGAQASPLMKKIDGSHHKVKLLDEEIRKIRFWIEAGGPYPGTHAALGGGAIGGYYQNMQLVNNDTEWQESVKASEAIERRCLDCHKGDLRIPNTLTHENGVSFWRPSKWNEPAMKRVRHMVYNLTIPEQSVMLLAPLAKENGGYSACKEVLENGKYGRQVEVFKNTSDPDYKAIQGMIEAGKNRLEGVTRFDMANFKPHPAYIREMKKYGILPENFNEENEKVDVYELDRKYWDSFIYKPEVQK